MAMQSFFGRMWKPNRVSQPTISGREIEGEVRIKVNGESIQCVKYRGVSNGKKRTMYVSVTDPTTGENVLLSTFEVDE